MGWHLDSILLSEIVLSKAKSLFKSCLGGGGLGSALKCQIFIGIT